MDFICHIFQRKDPYSPSLKQLRSFKLPGFNPRKVSFFSYIPIHLFNTAMYHNDSTSATLGFHLCQQSYQHTKAVYG